MTGIDLILSSICNATYCGVVYDNSIIDTQSSRKEIQLKHMINNINGRHLKIATYNNYPLSWVEQDKNGTLFGNGVAFYLVAILQETFNFTYEIIVPEKNYEMGGSKPEESLVGLANSNQVDMVAAFISKVIMAHKEVSYSLDLDEATWAMLLKRPKVSAAGSGLLAPFNNLVWYLIFASVFSFGPCITLLTCLRSKLIRDEEKTLPLSPSCWFVYSAFIKQGTSLAPEANTTRVLFATWWLFIILLTAFYTANLTAFLTLSKFTLDIENAKDLYKKNYKWVAAEGSSVEYTINTPNEDLYYLNKMVGKGGEFRHFTSRADYLPVVSVSGVVLIKETLSVDYLMYDDYLKKASAGVEEADRCTYVVAPNAFMKRQRAFIYPPGSYLKALFDPTLSHVVQSGIITFLKNQNLPPTKICPLDLQSKDRQLTNSDLIMTYIIMIVGLCAAIAVFIGELLLKRYIKVQQSKNIKTMPKKSKRNKHTSSRFFDDSRPPPYESLFAKSNMFKKDESQRKIINGREYYVFDNGQGGIRLVPIGTPSALLYR